jgi:hypothetical protein
MIHRIDRVNPDIDDRVIKPNEARSAKNLRFGASVEDTNLSGGILITGNERVSYAIPSGVNLVVGVMDDFEAQVVFFALYNSNGNHGIYRIKGSDNSVDRIVSGNWLNFTADMNVSMASIDGKLYWTDNLNQPKMVNVEKGIRTQKFIDGDPSQTDIYPLPAEEWMYTQIKRQPGLPLEIGNANIFPAYFSLEDASVDFNNLFQGNQNGYQFAYYYIYDNNEESRISAASQAVWFTQSISLRIPSEEYNAYILNKNVVKQISFIYRKNNDGIWQLASKVNNDASFTGTIQISNIERLGRTPVSTNITNADFDAVPRKSITNEIAQNRINHANYLIDYPNWDGLSLNIQVVKNQVVSTTITTVIPADPRFPRSQPRTVITTTNVLEPFNRTFFSGYYNVGIELLDEWGRRIAVVANQTIEVPTLSYQVTKLGITGTPFFAPAFFNEDEGQCYKINYEVVGNFPSWCKYWRVVYTKAQEYNYWYKTVAKVYDWYESLDVDYLVINGGLSSYKSLDGKGYNRKGIAVELSTNEPFVFNSSENQYIAYAKEYKSGQSSTIFPPENLTEHKIKKSNGRFLFIENNAISGWAFMGGNLDKLESYFPLYYQIYLYSKKETPEQIYYQSTACNTINSPRVGSIYGDAYLNKWKKTNNGTTNSILKIDYTLTQSAQSAVVAGSELVTTNSYELNGYGISMNPTNIYSQIWCSDIGQANIVNEDQKEVLLPNSIAFSDPLVQGTQINGLSKFNSVDFRQAPLENGPITALVTTNATQREPGVLLAIGTYGISSFYYDSIQLTNTDGESNITTTDRYLASQRPLLGQLGCSQPASITRTPLATVYWWSDIVNDMVRYTNAGLERLGLTYSFGNLLRTNLYKSDSVVTTYDQVTDEVSVWSRFKPYYTFSERFKAFQGEREYLLSGVAPERAIGLATKQFQFMNGRIFVTDINSTTAKDNLWFGEYKKPSITIVSNESPAAVKQWNQIKVYGPKPISTELKTGVIDGATLPLELTSYIKPEWYILRKGDWEAAIRRADNSSGGVLSGKLMESRILYSIFAFDPTTFTKLNFVDIKSNASIVQ